MNSELELADQRGGVLSFLISLTIAAAFFCLLVIFILASLSPDSPDNTNKKIVEKAKISFKNLIWRKVESKILVSKLSTSQIPSVDRSSVVAGRSFMIFEMNINDKEKHNFLFTCVADDGVFETASLLVKNVGGMEIYEDIEANIQTGRLDIFKNVITDSLMYEFHIPRGQVKRYFF